MTGCKQDVQVDVLVDFALPLSYSPVT